MADVDESLVTEMTSWRRHLHENPEFGFEEQETARFVAETLRRSGLTDIAEGIGGTGIVASLKLGNSPRIIALRADMDALRIPEATNLPHASKRPGLMHACGHDGHTTMLLGTALHLARHGGFDGTVRFVFQPAEEWGKGMQAMLDDGLLARFPFDEIYGLHNKPGLAIGHFETTPGPFYAAEDNFEITIEGSGGHASAPHRCRDAIVAGAAIVTEMQSIISRNIDPAELAVVSVTEFHSDGTRNAIAGSARIEGDCRSFSPAVSEAIEHAMRRIVGGIGKAHACGVAVNYSRVFVPLINHPAATAHAVSAAEAVFGKANVNPVANRMGGAEDFAQALKHVPGNFANIGNGESAVCHSPHYDFNDDGLIHGVRYFCALTRLRLAPA